jgi:ADP-ribosyl-[dinitrogen reductase] hydrolase
MPDLMLDRSTGALLGLAVGDALGAPFEGLERDTYPRASEYAAGGVHDIERGARTDDTAMAICLAESLLAHGGIDERDLLERFLRWFRFGENAHGGTAIGVSEKTRATLETFERSRRIDAAAAVDSAGNGAIMRLAPVAIYFRNSAAEACRSAVRQARVTHTARAALAAAELLADLLIVALRTGDPDAVLRAVTKTAHPDLIGIRDHRGKARQQISSAPRAIDTLEAALWCLHRAGDFEGTLVEAANLGGDSDTIGAVAGQLVCAIFGAAAIPPKWLDALFWRVRLAELARRLYETGALR